MIEFYNSSRPGEEPKYYLINNKAVKQNHLFSDKEDQKEWSEINEKIHGINCNELGEIEDLTFLNEKGEIQKNYKIVCELDVCGGDVKVDNKQMILTNGQR